MEDIDVYILSASHTKSSISFKFIKSPDHVESGYNSDDYYSRSDDYYSGTINIIPICGIKIDNNSGIKMKNTENNSTALIESIVDHMFINRLLLNISIERDYQCILEKHNIEFEFEDGVIVIPVYFNPDDPPPRNIKIELMYD